MKFGRSYTIVLLWTVFIYAVLQPQTQPLIAGESPSLLINEVMCHPTDNENTNEWIELYNPTEEPIDVSGWTIADEKETDTIAADSDQGDGTTSIPPGGYALLTDKGTTAYETFDVAETTVRLLVDDSTLCGYGLNNKKEKIVLMDQESVVIDAMEWGGDYDEVPGSPALVPSEGNSLGRSESTDHDDSFVDFSEMTPTPGAENLVRSEPDSEDDPEDDGEDIIEPGEDIESMDQPLLITELYYHTHPNIDAEYVRLMNPTNESVDVSRWYLTDEPWNEPDDQAKIIFPAHTVMPPNASWYITKNATAFCWETARLPEYEYGIDSHPLVPQLPTYRTISFCNTGGLVGLFSASQTLIDVVIYGDTDQYVSGWEGPAVNSSGQGIVLKRNRINGIPVDTDTSSDWAHPRIYHIGQSDFPLQTFSSPGDITVFVSPDNSYETIIHELHTAQRSIDITMYEFTNPFLFDELLDALTRNITVRLFMEGAPIGGMDDRQRYILSTLASQGVLVRFMVNDYDNHVNARYQFTHAKYLIIDNMTVIVESANWAKTGVPKDPTFGNREWGVVVRNDDVATFFSKVFQDDWNPLCRDSYPLEAMHLATFSSYSLDREVSQGSYQPSFSAQTISGPTVITPVLSPDNSEQAILEAIDNATKTIYIQQLYVYTDWGESMSPLLQHLINKSQQNVTICLILDYNLDYEATVALLNETKRFLESYGIQVKFISSEWSPFTAIHNKGMIIDNTTVLISSINWNEQSLRKNREAGILLKNTEAAIYYATVFLSDWYLEENTAVSSGGQSVDYKYLLLIAVVFGITFVLIVRDWRKRKWR